MLRTATSGGGAPQVDATYAALLVLLLLLALVVSRVAGLGVGRAQLTAVARATVQLAAVGLVVAAVLESLPATFAFVGVMLLVAAVTSSRRLGVPRIQTTWVLLSITLGAAPVVGLALALGVLPLNGVGVLPFAGIVIGNTMTAATLTGRRAGDELSAQRGTYEAALALGLPARDSALLVLQPYAAEGLVPGLDQTRTVGLVTLPGAFVGVLLGGGSATEAAAAQLLVLVGLVAAQAVTAGVVLRLVSTRRLMRADLERSLPR